jgi:hypothetical protein
MVADSQVSRVGLPHPDRVNARAGAGTLAPEVAPDVAALDFLYELDEIATAGGDIRARIFGA